MTAAASIPVPAMPSTRQYPCLAHLYGGLTQARADYHARAEIGRTAEVELGKSSVGGQHAQQGLEAFLPKFVACHIIDTTRGIRYMRLHRNASKCMLIIYNIDIYVCT